MSDDLITIDQILDDTRERMDKTFDAYKKELSRVRTGRASTSLVEGIRVEYYGSQTPMNQLATISVPESRTILIQPWDQSVIEDIEKAIMKSDLGVNPTNDGKVIRISIPALTEERRKELVKYVGKLTEDYRISVRQIRKDANNFLREVEKEESLSEDQVRLTQSEIQDITDEYIAKIDKAMEKKEKEIMQF